MLRRRSRPVPTNSKQQQHHIISDQNTHFSPPQEKPKKTPTSSFLNLTKIFKLFFINEIQTSKIMSPTLILDTKPFSILAKTLKKHSWEYPQESKGIGLAIVDEIANSEPKSSKMNPKLVLFGSQFKTHVALPSEFGIDHPRSDFSSSSDQIGVDANEMEHSEDYTCVISHGPNPRTTHIFGNSIVKTCNKVNGSSSLRQQQTQYHKGSRQSRVYNGSSSLQQQQTYEASHQSRVWTGSSSLKQEQTQCHKDSHQSRVCDGSSSLSTKIQKNYNFPEILSSHSPQNFLSCCCFCKKRLGQGQDIYMYRGEKAFCSQECRCQGMLFDDDEFGS